MSPAFVLVQGSGTADTERCNHDRRTVPVERWPPGAGHDECSRWSTSEEILFSWLSGLASAIQFPSPEEVLGNDGSILKGIKEITYTPELFNRPNGEALTGKTPSFCMRTCKTSSIAFVAGKRRLLRIAWPLPAVWQWRVIARSEPSAGHRSKRPSFSQPDTKH